MKGKRGAVIWHEVECGAYAADLELWEELADDRGGQVLDLGCGAGRVALHLARRGHAVTGLDIEPALVAALDGSGRRSRQLPRRSATPGTSSWEREFDLVLAPMQLLQLFADSEERIRCLRRVAAHLSPSGVAAFAIVESMPAPIDAASPLPDAREVDGWVFSSLPVDAQVGFRLDPRAAPAPDGLPRGRARGGGLRSRTAQTRCRGFGVRGARGRPAPGRAPPIPPTDAHVGSTVVLLRKGP